MSQSHPRVGWKLAVRGALAVLGALPALPPPAAPTVLLKPGAQFPAALPPPARQAVPPKPAAELPVERAREARWCRMLISGYPDRAMPPRSAHLPRARRRRYRSG